MLVSSSLQLAMDRAVAKGVFPGAVLAVRRGGERIWLIPVGRLSSDRSSAAVEASAIYDLASLTKPLVTVTSLALLVQSGRCRLDAPLASVLSELEGETVGSATFRQLLTHSSGLPGWRGFYEQLSPNAVLPSSAQERSRANGQLLELIRREPLIYQRGERSLYSDLGFMLLGLAIERLTGCGLDRFAQDQIVKPMRGTPMCYLPLNQEDSGKTPDWGSLIAPTEWDPWRNRLLCGEVHDENAAALGGVAGHAGLFGTAETVLAVTGGWLAAYHHRPSILEPEIVRDFLQCQKSMCGSSWVLGWDTPSSPSSSGQFFSQTSFGHLGFTGTSVWIDPSCELEVVLLSNRVHPTRKNEEIRAFRPLIHDLAYRECVGC
ncbi:MAG: serine hydrolase [Nitrospira sp.]|nr:serine hydrolase [Nitrospira sp.]